MADDGLTAGRRPTVVAPAETPGLTGLLTLAVAVVVVAGLYLGRTVLIPITLAVLLSFLLAPVVNLLRRIHLGRVLSVIVAVLLALSLILAMGGLIGAQLAGLMQDVPQYASTVRTKLESVQTFAASRMKFVAGRFEPQFKLTTHPRETKNPAEQKPVQVEVRQPDPTPLQLAERLLSPIVDPLSTTAIVLIVAIFVLLQREDLRDRLIRLFGSSDLHRTTVAMNDAAYRLSRYFLTQLGINAAFGVITGAGLFFIGVPSPLLWGIIGLLLRFVPYVGAALAAVFPLALAAAVSPDWSMMLWTAGLYLITEVIMGQVVEPLLYGRSTGLSPFSVVVAATFWTWLWGPIGLILSTPLTLCLVVLGRHVERLEFLDVILGDRPALTPVESFYQRMLAGDPDEARGQAEVLLRDRPLSSYYDEVALKGLQLAANDAARGVLTEAQLERIKMSMQDLIDDLDEYDDRDPVLCIAGRGPLDEAAASMLCQLLHKNGLRARVLKHEVTSRTHVGTLDGEGVVMVCLCYLEIGGTPSHLRYLLRRLRGRLPAARLLVGLWPTEQAILTDDRLRAALGADLYTCSLREAVEACLEAARADASPATA
jgi:predicted PurR-regulated permease PerM